ncbi:hypothetical protein nbrc107696_02760 [Gordonia spumicola]|uniref:Integral membrane bound transporter domain-containing protein n=1 Tax=Gordonia spumicola TaxID=589161 RepID=A0A7I9V486_9ACTN|nr:FUSC family protein [Gordonia spumicola]GED99829.1 hypothetical protein nbrc107696_02760 [Gordonia spumicola]
MSVLYGCSRRWRGFAAVFRGSEVAARTAVLAGVGLVILGIVGRVDLSAYTMFGAFCAAYGGNETYATRGRTVALAGVLNTGAIIAGVLLAWAHGSEWVRFGAFAVMIPIAVIMAYRYELVPAQPFFPAISLGVCGVIPVAGAGDAAMRIGLAVLATVVSWAFCMSGWLVRRVAHDGAVPSIAPGMASTMLKDLERTTRVRDLSPGWPAIGAVVGLIVVSGAISELTVHLLGLPRSYWALITCASVMPVVGGAISFRKSVERVVGTAIGVGVLTLFPSLPLPLVLGIAIIVVCQFFTQLLVVAYYVEALVFITVLVFVSLGYAMPLDESDLLARLADTAIGAAVSLLLLTVAVRLVPALMRPGGLVRDE